MDEVLTVMKVFAEIQKLQQEYKIKQDELLERILLQQSTLEEAKRNQTKASRVVSQLRLLLIR